MNLVERFFIGLKGFNITKSVFKRYSEEFFFLMNPTYKDFPMSSEAMCFRFTYEKVM